MDAPAIIPEKLSQEQIELIKNTVAVGATDNELQLFLYTAKRTGLDPLTKQIHFIKRSVYDRASGGYVSRGTIQTGIDGYRVVASRNGLAGIDDVIYDDETKAYPNKATVTVYRNVSGTRVPFTASARWSEYVQAKDGKPVAMWAKMPFLMLGKVAEALALRKAFPNDLTGVYTTEEMSQAENTEELKTVPPRMESYTVERVVPPSDDEAGGNTEKTIQFLEQDEINSVLKEEIKASLFAMGKKSSKTLIKELTGLDPEPANLQAIRDILKKQQEATDPLAQGLNAAQE